MLSRALSASEFSPLYTSGRGKSSFLRETTTVVTAAGEVRLNFYRMNFSRAPAGKFLLSLSLCIEKNYEDCDDAGMSSGELLRLR